MSDPRPLTTDPRDTSPLGKLRALRAAIDREGCPDWNEVLRHGLSWVSSGVAASRRQALTCGDVRALLGEFAALNKRLAQINTLACYASEENTAMQPAALLEIGKLARGEDTIPWPEIR